MKDRLLLIDDELITYDWMVEYLQRLRRGTKLSHARSLEEGLKMVEEEEWDVIFVDVAFPGAQIGGVSLISKIRLARPDVAIVALTNFGYEDVKQDCDNAGADGFIEKWPREAEMLSLLRSYLGTALADRGDSPSTTTILARLVPASVLAGSMRIVDRILCPVAS